jgi:hypothetical protein
VAAPKKPTVLKDLPSADVAISRIQSAMRCKLARKRVSQRRAAAKARQARAGRMVHWAVVTLQRIARAKIGRRKFKAHAVVVKVRSHFIVIMNHSLTPSFIHSLTHSLPPSFTH